jgi:hypothetical protein
VPDREDLAIHSAVFFRMPEPAFSHALERPPAKTDRCRGTQASMVSTRRGYPIGATWPEQACLHDRFREPEYSKLSVQYVAAVLIQ